MGRHSGEEWARGVDALTERQLDPSEGIRDQARLDAFFDRQTDPGYDAAKLSAVEALRHGQAGAFSIMNMLSNGRHLPGLLKSDFSSPAWVAALEALDHVMGLGWWTRVWVVQEAILCVREVTAIYGEARAPIGLIEDSGAMLPRHYEKGECCKGFWNDLPQRQREILNRFARQMYILEGMRDYWTHVRDDQLKTLTRFLEQTRPRKSSDPRDKIYGLLGLIRDSANPTDLRPDYSRSSVDLYTDVAMRIIRHENSLSVLANHERKVSAATAALAAASSSSWPAGLPTWVPNWTAPEESGNDNNSNEQSSPDYQKSMRITQFRAGLFEPWEAEVADGYALGVRGIEVDRIAAVDSTPLRRADTNLAARLDSFERMCGLDVDPFRSYPGTSLRPAEDGGSQQQLLEEAFWRTMLGDVFYDVDRSMILERITFERLYASDGFFFGIARYVWNNAGDDDDALQENTTLQQTRNPLQNKNKKRNNNNMFFLLPDGTVLSDPQIAYIARRAEDNFWLANEGRVFFRTDGGLIGFGPADTKVADRVVVVLGSCVPFVVRPVVDCGGSAGGGEGRCGTDSGTATATATASDTSTSVDTSPTTTPTTIPTAFSATTPITAPKTTPITTPATTPARIPNSLVSTTAALNISPTPTTLPARATPTSAPTCTRAPDAGTTSAPVSMPTCATPVWTSTPSPACTGSGSGSDGPATAGSATAGPASTSPTTTGPAYASPVTTTRTPSTPPAPDPATPPTTRPCLASSTIDRDCARYHLVGFSYTHGIMDGEAVRAQAGKKPERRGGLRQMYLF